MNPYYTHQKYLIEELEKLTGSALVLEFGVGGGSSSVFHRFAQQNPGLRIEAYEDNHEWIGKMIGKYTTDRYHFNHIGSWDSFFAKTVFDEIYDLVFVDSSPWEARIQAIEAVKDRTKVFIVHDYNYFNRGVVDDLCSISKGSFWGDRYGEEFILEKNIEYPGNLEYPATLIMRKI